MHFSPSIVVIWWTSIERLGTVQSGLNRVEQLREYFENGAPVHLPI